MISTVRLSFHWPAVQYHAIVTCRTYTLGEMSFSTAMGLVVERGLSGGLGLRWPVKAGVSECLVNTGFDLRGCEVEGVRWRMCGGGCNVEGVRWRV